jgi:hypothetical protein
MDFCTRAWAAFTRETRATRGHLRSEPMRTEVLMQPRNGYHVASRVYETGTITTRFLVRSFLSYLTMPSIFANKV